MKELIKNILREQKSEILYLPGDKKWEYTLIDDVWHTRHKGSDKKWLSLGDDKWEKTTKKLDKAFLSKNPDQVKGKSERHQFVKLDYDTDSAWKAFRKQNEDRMKQYLEDYKWDMLMTYLEIPEEDSEEPQVILDLNAMVEAIEAGKSDRQIMKSKQFKNLKLDKEKLAFWRKQYDKPEIKSIWVRGKDKINKWLKGLVKDEDVVVVKENTNRNLIKKVIKEEVIDVTSFQEEVFSLPLEQRKAVIRGLETLLVSKQNEDKLNEQINYKGIPELKAHSTIGKIFKWFKRYITDKATNFLINASMSEVKDTIQMLKVLDPTDMSGIFKPKAMYLGGGIDFAEDGASWRTKIEEFYGPDHIVKDERLLELVTTGKLDFKGLEYPTILNPLRAETVRAEDPQFQEMFAKWKANELTGEDMVIFQEKIREQIVHQDLYMLQVCDTNLISFDGTAGAGTFGEAQISALKNQQVFIWLNKGMKMSNISPWLFPSITKILKEDELWPFLERLQ